MKKLIRGILEFRKTRRPDYAEAFSKLALGQSPDSLFIACSDSRVVPNLFASSEPGDLLVLRNVGNIVAPCGPQGVSESDESEAAALEFSLRGLRVADLIVCGHSECAAMRALLDGGLPFEAPHFRGWLRHAAPALARLRDAAPRGQLAAHNRLSQANVLTQVENLRTYPLVREAEAAGQVRLHAWWFDIARAEVLGWDAPSQSFVPIDEDHDGRVSPS
jgi:carbonic anhydrase